jgi:hypothetical protein
MPVPLRWLVAVAAIFSVFLAIDSLRLFSEQPWMEFVITVQNHYYYALLALLLPFSFLIFGVALQHAGGILMALPGLESMGIPIGDVPLFVTGLSLSVIGILASRRSRASLDVSGAV